MSLPEILNGMLYPLAFHPRFKERIWGGRRLETLYGKRLPPEAAIGESWEITDRPGDVSVIANGRLRGKDLRWLLEMHGADMMGDAGFHGRFPLLVKLLDARQTLSLQVHPPAELAARLGGEPKTEVWLVADAKPGAELYVGLRRGLTRAEFERRIADGTVATCVHRAPVQAGDAMFLPSGRVHALGAGLVIFEIQQNSDTTYRVFDWNRAGLDGRPRELHIQESLASIDFADHEPGLIRTEGVSLDAGPVRVTSPGAPFSAYVQRLPPGGLHRLSEPGPWVLGVINGAVEITGCAPDLELRAGDFCLVPACVQDAALSSDSGAKFIRARPG